MPVAPPVDRNQPSFQRFDIQNDRTGWQDVALPLVLVVPWTRSRTGTPLSDTAVSDLVFYIEDAPNPAKVAGAEHIGMQIPNQQLYSYRPEPLELYDRRLNTLFAGFTFYGPDKTTVKAYEDAVDGDYFQYRLAGNSVVGLVLYHPDTDYFDLSAFTLTVDGLPTGNYVFVWQCSYFARSITTDGDFACITTDQRITRFALPMTHPGEAHQMLVENMPAVYLQDVNRSDDAVVKFIRAYADGLQDIYDEQKLLLGLNWIDKVPAQFIPYLAYLIGWDLPNFPTSTDAMRRAVLRNGARLQRMKGTRQVIAELFKIFGFAVELINLWSSTDGKRFIAPGEKLPSSLTGQTIQQLTKCQTDVLLGAFTEAGFGEQPAPLLFRPINQFSIETWHVTRGGAADTALQTVLQALAQSPETLETCQTDPAGFPISSVLSVVPLGGTDVIGLSRVLVDPRTGENVEDVSFGKSPLSKGGVAFNQDFNTATLTFDHYLDFTDDDRLYSFAVYPQNKIYLPSVLTDLRSNRFDVNILYQDGQQIEGDLFEYLIDFIFKLKAFHSLLRKITFTVAPFDVYNVTEYCVGGLNRQDPSFSGGKLEIPPYAFPTGGSSEICPPGTESGAGTANQKFRSKILNGLIEEHQAWAALDNTHIIPDALKPIVAALSRVAPGLPEGTACQYTQRGQDLVQYADHVKLCDDFAPVDKCYVGRVVESPLVTQSVHLSDYVRCRPCNLTYGKGLYYLMPQKPLQLNEGGRFGRLRREYDDPNPYLHFTDRPYLQPDLVSRDLLGWQRGPVDVQKPNWFLPGHRFIRGGLTETFTHPDWKARPWDFPYQADVCNGWQTVNPLHAVLTTVGDAEWLTFDDTPLIYAPNGVVPDVPHYSQQPDPGKLVTHKIYGNSRYPLAPGDPRNAIVFEQIVPTTESGIMGNVPEIFHSRTTCGDFSAGMPATTGRFDYDGDHGYDRNPDWDEALQLPSFGTHTVNLQYTYGSGVLVDPSDFVYPQFRGWRFDCDCLRFDCGTGTGGTELPDVTVPDSCLSDKMRHPNGVFDPSCDQLETLIRMLLIEKFGCCSDVYDGTILNYLNVVGSQTSGSYIFRDSWDTIYEFSFRRYDNRIDIVTVTKIPYVWGEPQTGEIRNGRVWRRGIVTAERQMLEIIPGGYRILASGSEQAVELFQTSFMCDDVAPQKISDVFTRTIDCGIKDECSARIRCGPHWADPANSDDDLVWWPFLVDTGTAMFYVLPDATYQKFGWIDVWGPSEEVTGVCPPLPQPSSGSGSQGTGGTGGTGTGGTGTGGTGGTGSEYETLGTGDPIVVGYEEYGTGTGSGSGSGSGGD
ncbi:MAG: phage tail protein [Candidatus Nanopelagicaceae bacterium]|nr:phage tail protein [Candidatus Nanopelagicaceae bacterium]